MLSAVVSIDSVSVAKEFAVEDSPDAGIVVIVEESTVGDTSVASLVPTSTSLYTVGSSGMDVVVGVVSGAMVSRTPSVVVLSDVVTIDVVVASVDVTVVTMIGLVFIIGLVDVSGLAATVVLGDEASISSGVISALAAGIELIVVIAGARISTSFIVSAFGFVVVSSLVGAVVVIGVFSGIETVVDSAPLSGLFVAFVVTVSFPGGSVGICSLSRSNP